MHNKAFFCLKKRILNYYSLSLTTQCVTHCPKELKRKQMKECYSRERERNATTFELSPQKKSLGPLLSPAGPL